ncbi:MAG: nitronate monooxygenase [Deltaproteobacteria bacterium]|nr:nitronate monooxygenase [Deltaproteobacteria bacterium]MBW2419537.1 nitronate monooxygenase [Deltaproteobacteria bacterium]
MRTELCDLFGIDVPIFAFSHCRDVVAAVTNAGGMGVLGALAFSPEQLDKELKWIDAHVGGKPYGVDIVMPAGYEGKDRGLGKQEEDTGKVDPEVFENLIPEEVKAWIETLLEEYDIPPLPADFEAASGIGGHDSQGLLGWTEGGARGQLDVALEYPVKLLVNALGPPPKDIIDHAHSLGIKVAALTGAVKHALRQKEQGVDIVIAQGTEAGGHTGEIGSMVLIPDIVDAVAPNPVLGAGGIAGGRQAAAALALGAQGVWTGSCWLTVKESEMTANVMDKLLAAGAEDAVRSKTLSGKPARLLRTAWTEAWLRSDCPGTLPMPLQYMACSEAQQRIGLSARAGNPKALELLGSPVGQVVSRLNQVKSSAQVVSDFIDEFVEAVERLDGLVAASERHG